MKGDITYAAPRRCDVASGVYKLKRFSDRNCVQSAVQIKSDKK